MNLVDLQHEECVVLLGLIHFLVQADADRTEEEMTEFREIAKELGRKAFDAALHEALRRFASEEAALTAAADLTRRDARELIYTVLVDLAASDGIAMSERVLLARLSTLWGTGRPLPLD